MDLSPKEDTFEDKIIKFDILDVQKKTINGEEILAKIIHIEDSKGNPGDVGCLVFTNLRLIWHSIAHRKHNLSIGWGTVSIINKGTTFDKVRGPIDVLHVQGNYSGSRFEFLFNNTSNESQRNDSSVFDNAIEFHRLYQRTYLYRELKLRCAILQGGQLILLPQEQIFNTLNGIMNLSSDQGNLGVFVITNIRLVWYSDANDNFNLSLSYRQIANISVRMSKYGQTLVIGTTEVSGGYILGFRIDPIARLYKTERELITLHKAYILQPKFGINYNFELPNKKLQYNDDVDEMDFRTSEFSEIDEKQEVHVHSKMNKYLKSNILSDNTEMYAKGPVYSSNLGFAIELIGNDCDLADLWNICPEK